MHNGETSLKQTDTAAWAQQRQVELYRAMSPQQRFETACSMSEAARERSLAGLQQLYPSEGDLQLRVRLATFVYGEAAGVRLQAALAKRAR
ncbi:MAG: hypothetical protein Q8N23_10105 [Archangium sp.]|nr:hypothetical protein [Archangium sp.]MDP3153012.1 hypothetical protein [Archangium sp.]MDP3572600.1 hypothetical protein [Archangium sp.]